CNKEHLAYLNGHTPVTDADWQLFDRQLFKFEVVELEHLKSEEEQALARLQQLLSEEDKDALWREWDAALRNAPLRPHPDGPTNGIPAKLMHPVAGVVDRVTQAVEGLMANAGIGGAATVASCKGHEQGVHQGA
ncbi:hemerythrin domain-containing protein, partial [Haematococcus lacustris]